jgi:hypothetical protein
MCETRVLGVLGGMGVLGGGQTLVLHILGVLGGIWVSGSFSPTRKSCRLRKQCTKSSSTKETSISYYIYIYLYRGGAI